MFKNKHLLTSHKWMLLPVIYINTSNVDSSKVSRMDMNVNIYFGFSKNTTASQGESKQLYEVVINYSRRIYKLMGFFLAWELSTKFGKWAYSIYRFIFIVLWNYYYYLEYTHSSHWFLITYYEIKESVLLTWKFPD